MATSNKKPGLFDHGLIEKNVTLMMVLILLTVSIGGLVEIIPLFTIESTIEKVEGVRPYQPVDKLLRSLQTYRI